MDTSVNRNSSSSTNVHVEKTRSKGSPFGGLVFFSVGNSSRSSYQQFAGFTLSPPNQLRVSLSEILCTTFLYFPFATTTRIDPVLALVLAALPNYHSSALLYRIFSPSKTGLELVFLLNGDFKFSLASIIVGVVVVVHSA